VCSVWKVFQMLAYLGPNHRQCMAIIRGKAGKYTGEEAARLRSRTLILGLVMMALIGVCEGVTLSNLWSRFHPPAWLTRTVQCTGFVGMLGLSRLGMRKMDEWDKERTNWQRGGEGETVIGKILATFPDGYYVFNDVKVPGQKANLDHVVVGPTGVFMLDTKNWRGLVEDDGAGELLLNRKRLDRDYIHEFVRRVMTVKDMLYPEGQTAPYFRGLFVFTAARVEAKWGKTGQVHCMCEDQLWDYIVENKFAKRISAETVKGIAERVRRMAQLDPKSTHNAKEAFQTSDEQRATATNVQVKAE
jgi:hypothetical protein